MSGWPDRQMVRLCPIMIFIPDMIDDGKVYVVISLWLPDGIDKIDGNRRYSVALGLTIPLSCKCAAALAKLQVYEDDSLIITVSLESQNTKNPNPPM